MKDYTDDLIDELIKADIASKETIEPCTPDEVAEIEKLYSVTLPEAYKQFLLKMGHGAGSFMEGTDLFYPYLPKLREYAENLLDRWDNPFALSKTDFVFLDHQGNQFMYFDTAAGNDPPIYHYKEAQYKSEQVSPSFSDWLQCRAKEEIYLQEQISALEA